MSVFICRRSQIIVSHLGVPVINSSTHLGFTRNHLAFAIRLLSTYPARDKQNQRSFVVSYLINSCGLSPESAKSVSKQVDFKTSHRPDSVLTLLKDYGFTNAHISKLIRKRARVLLLNPEEKLSPKLEFLSSIAVSRSDLPDIVSSNPDLSSWSLHDHLIPTYNMLKSILGSNEEVVKCLKRTYMYDISKNSPINIAFLRNLKIPQRNISYLLTRSPSVVCANPSKLSEIVNKVIELGLDPSKRTFVNAIQIISNTSYKTWDQKMKVYRSWGFSEDEIWLAIRKCPFCMFISAKKINGIMEFLVNKLGLRPADVVRYPVIFCCSLEKINSIMEFLVDKMGCLPADLVRHLMIFGYNLEKRIIPRFSVIRVLKMKGLVKADLTVSSVMAKSEKQFLDAYVIKYEGEIPQLLGIFRGEMSILE